MPSVKALRGTGAGGCQWVDVHYEEDHLGQLHVTGVSGAIQSIGSKYCTADLHSFVGKEFASRRDLNRALNGSDNVLGDL